MKRKKGVSIIVGEVILIGIVLALGVSYFVWTKTLSSTAGSQGAGEVSCSQISLLIGDVCYNTVGANRQIQFSTRNDAEIKIWNFSIMVEYEGEIKTFYPLGESDVEQNDFKTIKSQTIDYNINSPPKRAIISPIIKIDKQLFICEGKKLVKVWEEIENC